MTDDVRDVVVVGGGPAGLSAAVFTARHDLDTLVIDDGTSILRRNAHLENFPGFPAGVNARQLLDLISEQAERAGAQRREDRVEQITTDEDEFLIETEASSVRSRYVIAATKNEIGYLKSIEGVGTIERGKTFVDVDEGGRTGVDGLYVAGRLAEKPHQAIVCAGHGAEVAVTLLEDDEQPFYHDWVAPDGYFTDRDRPLPPGCEEIDDEQRRERDDAARALLRDRFETPHPDEQETHPSLE